MSFLLLCRKDVDARLGMTMTAGPQFCFG